VSKAEWTPEAEQRLAKLWNSGASSGVCAERFGRRPATIIAKIGELRRRGVKLRSGKAGAPGRSFDLNANDEF